MGQARSSPDLACAELLFPKILTCIAPCTVTAGSGHSTAAQTESRSCCYKGEKKEHSGRRAPSPLADQAVTHLRAADLGTVDAGDGVYEVVGLVNDHNLVLQLDPSSIPGRLMQKHLIGQHHQLQERHTLP